MMGSPMIQTLLARIGYSHSAINTRYVCLLLIGFSCLPCCQAPNKMTPEALPVFRLLNPASTKVDFINKVTPTADFNIITYRNFYNGGGVAIGDINNDGLPDLFFTANQGDNKLYLNKGNLTWQDITISAGVAGTKAWSTGVTMVDINADGLLDIYVCNSGDIRGDDRENELFINQGDLTFIDQAKANHLDNKGYSTHAAFLDYDRDGDLDCYILNNSFKNPAKIELHQSMRTTPDSLGGHKLMRNDLDTKGTFTDVTEQAGIYSSAIGFGLGIAIGDLNGDHWPDLYISNDFFEKDYVYINQQNGTFLEDLNHRVDYCSTSSMGGDIGDINGDGSPDIFTTDMLPADNDRIKRMVVFEPYHLEDLKYRANYYYQFTQNCLHLNDGSGHFQEIAHLAGVAATDWSWGAMIFDFQNDGTNDIFVANGIYKDLMEGDFRDFVYDENNKKADMGQKNLAIHDQLPSLALQNYAFVNRGPLDFKNEAEQLGLKEKTFSNGSSYGDLDNDGDLDLVLNNVNQPGMIYENTTNAGVNTYLKIKFEGPEHNKFGLGAQVSINHQGRVFYKENFNNRGFQSSIEPNLLFGLGDLAQVDTLTVTWPDGLTETQLHIKTKQTLILKYKQATATLPADPALTKPMFTSLNATEYLNGAVHHENVYNDFYQEPLLLAMLSTQGPKMAKVDVNADGREDLVLLGARGDPDKLFIQQANGRYRRTNVALFEKDKAFESTCAAFFDFDQDDDQDLIISSGGNEIGIDKLNYIIRLYLNDGKGIFAIDPDHIPPVIGNLSTLKVADYDQDGDQDLFIGARAIPGNYGLKPQSYLLKNEGGYWSDQPQHLPGLGMVTDGAWADINGDSWLDLVVVGDWMTIQVYFNVKGIISDLPQELAGSSGWWQKIVAEDLDLDGDPDFVVGNWGLNSKFQPTAAIPLTMQVADLDQNGKTEFIINWRPPGDTQNFPFCTKAELTGQIPSLRKTELKYIDFAPMTFDLLFPNYPKANLTTYTASTLSSGILWNEGGKLTLKSLPHEAQVAPVTAIVVHDFDQDGIKDIVLGGNFYALKPQVGRQAASRGLLLTGSKNDHQFLPSLHSGLQLRREVRDLIVVNNKLIVAYNNQACELYSF